MRNSDLWTYREDVWVITPMSDTDDAHTSNTRTRIGMMDLAGFEIEARDGSIGKVDEATNETSGSWLIVDNGSVDLRPEGHDPGRCRRADR